MQERVSIDHVGQIKLVTTVLLTQIAQNPQTRRVLEVATQKVEYVEENQAIRARHLAVRRSFMERCETLARAGRAASRREVRRRHADGGLRLSRDDRWPGTELAA